MFIEKKNVLGNVDNKIQAESNIIIHISICIYSNTAWKFWDGNQPRLASFSLATAQYHTNSNSRKQVNNEESLLRRHCHLNKPNIHSITKKLLLKCEPRYYKNVD